MGLPRKPDSYVHRIGRTGRAGQIGKAISFVAPDNSRGLKTIEKLINDKLQKFIIPTAQSSKRNKINIEIDRMSSFKKTLLDRKDDFSIDQSFDLFNEFLIDMNREEIIKLMFSYQFNKDLKEIDEAVLNFKSSVVSRDNNRRSNFKTSGKRQKRGRNRTRRY